MLQNTCLQLFLGTMKDWLAMFFNLVSGEELVGISWGHVRSSWLKWRPKEMYTSTAGWSIRFHLTCTRKLVTRLSKRMASWFGWRFNVASTWCPKNCPMKLDDTTSDTSQSDDHQIWYSYMWYYCIGKSILRFYVPNNYFVGEQLNAKYREEYHHWICSWNYRMVLYMYPVRCAWW